MTTTIFRTEKRWGDTHIDRRDWKTYNEQLVKRGEIFVDFDICINWEKELFKMNEKKKGAPFQFPETYIEIQALWKAKQIPYRSIAGAFRRLCMLGNVPAYNNFSTINRRVNKLAFDIQLPVGNNLTIFSDGTSLQVVEGGEYLREKYGKKNRKWVQVVLLGDPDSKEPVSIEVNIVQGSELESAKKQLDELLEKKVDIDEFGGDGAFDEIALWNKLQYLDIKPCIKPDKNAIIPSGSRLRDDNVKERNTIGYNLWCREHGYGYRWTATEGIFSAIKRMFGEKLHARSHIGLIQESKLKFWAYQKVKRYGEA